MTTITTAADLLTDDMLARFDARAATYDRENRFFDEDWDELRNSGYLLAAVPTEFGGSGLGLDEVARLQGMHLYWTGVAADLLKAGDTSLRWVLEKAAAGEVFAAIHGEAGNDIPLLLSSSKAEKVPGGYEITGHKIFGSLSPVWTLAGFHAMDTSDPANPKIVHGFLPRNTSGYEIVETWDTLGMRATQSHDTVLDRPFVIDPQVPAGILGESVRGDEAVLLGRGPDRGGLGPAPVPGRVAKVGFLIGRCAEDHPAWSPTRFKGSGEACSRAKHHQSDARGQRT